MGIIIKKSSRHMPGWLLLLGRLYTTTPLMWPPKPTTEVILIFTKLGMQSPRVMTCRAFGSMFVAISQNCIKILTTFRRRLIRRPLCMRVEILQLINVIYIMNPIELCLKPACQFGKIHIHIPTSFEYFLSHENNKYNATKRHTKSQLEMLYISNMTRASDKRSRHKQCSNKQECHYFPRKLHSPHINNKKPRNN